MGQNVERLGRLRANRSNFLVVGEHVAQTAQLLASRSALIHERVEDGSLAIVGAEYDLAHGRVRIVEAVGTIDLDTATDVAERATGADASAASPEVSASTAGG